MANSGLRFDKVVLGLADRLRHDLEPFIAQGLTVLVTVTAPIRLPAKTAEALERRVKHLLSKPSTRDVVTTLHGNAVRIRVLQHAFAAAPKVAAFVHNPEADAVLILEVASEMLRR